jgi:hypothetical protein
MSVRITVQTVSDGLSEDVSTSRFEKFYECLLKMYSRQQIWCQEMARMQGFAPFTLDTIT